MGSWDEIGEQGKGGRSVPGAPPAAEPPPQVVKGVRHIGKGSAYYEPTPRFRQGSASEPSTLESALPPIGGWLLAFVVVRVFVGPIWMVAVAALEWWWLDSIYELQMGILATFPGLVYGTMLDIALGFIVTGYAVYAGIVVWRQRIHAVAVAKSSIVVSAAYAVFQAVLPFAATLPPQLTFWLTLIRGISSFVILTGLAAWYVYFRVADRVATTLPSAGAGQVQKLGI